MPESTPIKRLPIDLDQFLKLAGVVPSGGEAKMLINEGMVSINGEPESKRRRKLNEGDVVTVEGTGEFAVTQAE